MSGKIKGPESHAAQYAIKNNIFYVEFTPDWNMQEGKAILSRNINMAKDGDELIAIYDGINKSTNHIIDIMLTLNKPVWVYNISNFPLELRRLV
jgi:hypothetical protein